MSKAQKLCIEQQPDCKAMTSHDRAFFIKKVGVRFLSRQDRRFGNYFFDESLAHCYACSIISFFALMENSSFVF